MSAIVRPLAGEAFDLSMPTDKPVNVLVPALPVTPAARLFTLSALDELPAYLATMTEGALMSVVRSMLPPELPIKMRLFPEFKVGRMRCRFVPLMPSMMV